jgi:deazaflavin-dependent oxidoreductase (nitroreductase family)
MGYANRAVLAILRSPARTVLDRKICALRYAGRRTGRVYTLPVQYARTPDGVVIAVGSAGRKSWWRNLRTASKVEIWLDGRWHAAAAELVAPTARPEAEAAYRTAFTRAPAGLPFVRVRMDAPYEPPPLRGRLLLRRWIAWATIGEACGFAVPAVVGAATVDVSAAISFAALLAAGAVEGAMLGAAQAHVLRQAVPGLPSGRWTARTSAAAVLAYALGLTPSTLAGSWPRPALIAFAAVAGVVLLVSIGAAQWTVLRDHVPHAARWIAITAGAWLAGLAAFLVVATPLWQPGQPLWLTVLIGGLAGLLMAAVVAVLTGIGLTRLLDRTPAAG